MQEPVYTAKVPYNKENITRCMCAQCPVQGQSSCASEEIADLDEALQENPLDREKIPAEYCSSGSASCKDLDFRRTCICGSCPVFAEYNLATGEPAGYFCRYGSTR